MFDFLEVAWGLAGEQPFPLETLEALARLIPCDSVGYTDVDRVRRVVVSYTGTDADEFAELEVGLAESRARTRNLVLDRSSGDFSARDVAVLERLRPHLARIRELAELRRAVTASPAVERLTAREREILEHAAAGLTNAQIAERLWISPGTVRKHLEHVYGKLGVTNRTAAAARLSGPE